MTPEEVIAEVRRSGLRGRGGAGFPTGVKWDICRQVAGDEKYVICNADEGDPGAFMDRSILEADPHSVIEGLIILAYAIGASQGFVYCRAEYPLAVRRVRIALQQARGKGYLGRAILGSDFHLDIDVFEGAGAFVCGEETALIASIEGKRGMPRTRPPFPAVRGLWDKPTVINNVKTLASVPVIITRGADWFASIGTKNSKGTAVFALTGKIANSGLVEVAMGTPLSSIIYSVGGGIPNKKKLKAVQTGGPSGGCLPASMLELPVDFDSLAEAGSMMGSGGLVVMDEDTCMVDVARFFLSFTQSESCGKCAPCRVGIRHLVNLLEKICNGKGEEEDLEKLERLAIMVKKGSLCALGQTAPNPVLSALRYFRSEFVAHVVDKRCPAVVCRELVTFRILPERCTGCQRCVAVCPTKAIKGPRSQPHNLDRSKCIKCRSCYEVCRFDAIAGDAIVIES
jgi:NADH:ubiquinone oxidoreductase subunit F (NADH-binding)/NAD-dependent dihydropyrimidine dehydrogenase PreA subunit